MGPPAAGREPVLVRGEGPAPLAAGRLRAPGGLPHPDARARGARGHRLLAGVLLLPPGGARVGPGGPRDDAEEAAGADVHPDHLPGPAAARGAAASQRRSG